VGLSQFGSTVSRSAIPEDFDDSSLGFTNKSSGGCRTRSGGAARVRRTSAFRALGPHAAPATPAIDARPRASRPRDGAALTACAATPKVVTQLGRGRVATVPWTALSGFHKLRHFPTARFQFSGRQALESVRRGNAVGGAVTPPTAFQSVSEKPREPGPNSSTGAVFAAVRIPSRAAPRGAC
jgi:hypothetical protein